MDYAEFLEKKAILDLPTGMTELPELPDALFPVSYTHLTLPTTPYV